MGSRVRAPSLPPVKKKEVALEQPLFLWRGGRARTKTPVAGFKIKNTAAPVFLIAEGEVFLSFGNRREPVSETLENKLCQLAPPRLAVAC